MEKNFDMSQQKSYICKYLNDLVEHLNNRTESSLMPLVTSVPFYDEIEMSASNKSV